MPKFRIVCWECGEPHQEEEINGMHHHLITNILYRGVEAMTLIIYRY